MLTIGYSALAERVRDICTGEVPASVDVLVCVQGDAAYAAPPRARTIPVAGLGVARSRNAAIDAAHGRYLLFCDDDVQVHIPGVLDGVRHLEASGHAIALGRGVDPGGQHRKKYPSTTTRLTRFNTAKTATYEILIDLVQVREVGIRFDERFGAGAPLYLADEYIFVADLLQAGLRGDFVPYTFGVHPVASSGHRWGSDIDVHVRAVALNRVFGRTAPAARLTFAVRNRRFLDARRMARLVFDNGRP